jgi:hypothetical protein
MANNNNVTSARVQVVLGSKVDGTLPAPLVLVISDAQWKAFVDEVDRVSLEVRHATYCTQGMITLIVGGIIIYFVRFVMMMLDAEDADDFPTDADDFPTGKLLIGLGLLTIPLVASIPLHFLKKRALEQLQAIAERTSSALMPPPPPNNSSSNNISVHFRQGTYPYHDAVAFAGWSILYYFEFIHCVTTKSSV